MGSGGSNALWSSRNSGTESWPALTHPTYQRRSLRRPFRGLKVPLPGNATGVTTGTPEVRPLRSSRTRSSPSQISNVHGR
eukprot:gene36416-44917_t